MENLVTLSQEITLSWKAAFKNWTGEKKGATEKEPHLAKVINECRVLSDAGRGQESPNDRTAVPYVGNRGGHHLTDLAHPRWPAIVAVFAVTAAEAGQTAEEGGSWHEDPTNVSMVAFIHDIVKVNYSTAILILCHTDIIQEIEGKMAQLRFAAQQVSCYTKGRVG